MTANSPIETVSISAQPAPARKTTIPRYALGLLVAIYVLNTLDRQIVNILAEPIKHDLSLKDWQIGIMTGLAFAVFYATLGIPIARLAERGNRPFIIAASVTLWSMFTALCGLSQNFIQLVMARVGVGVGEAGCSPAAHSLISDLVPREKRASALGLYAMGAPLGALLGMALGGLLADLWGWRSAFLIAAAPGLVVGLVTALTLKEPRKLLKAAAKAVAPAPTFKEALRELKACRSFWLFSCGAALQGLIAYGHSAFLGSFFFRNHGPELAHIAGGLGMQTSGFLGVAIGLLSGLSGMLGAFFGGKLADRHTATNPRGLATQVAVFNLLAVPSFILAMWVPSTPLALALLFLPGLFYGMTYGPLFAVFQSVVQPTTRATAVAVYMLMTNLVGLGVGPLLVGVTSDYFAEGLKMGSGEGLRWAQILSTLLGFVAFWLYWRARRCIADDTVG